MNTDPVETKIQIDDREARVKFDEYERRLKKFEEGGKRAGKSGGAFMSAAIGGAAGFVAGAAMNNPATSAISDLLINVIAAALLPVMVAMLPVLKGLEGVLGPIAGVLATVVNALVKQFGPDVLAGSLVGAYVGGKLGGPVGAAVGAGLGGGAAGVGYGLNDLQRPVPQGPEDAHSGTVFVTGSTSRTSTPNEKVPVQIGPISVPVDRGQLWGPDIVG